MYTSSRRRSTQHIEIVLNSQLYNTADRQPLPAGPVRTATPRRRVSPYPLPRPARALTPPSKSRDPSPGSSGEDIAAPPDARSGSITDLDYAETSDGDDAGSRDGDAVGRSTAPLRAHFSVDSSCDGWSNSGEDLVEEYATATVEPSAHPRRPAPSHSSTGGVVPPLRTHGHPTPQARLISQARSAAPVRPPVTQDRVPSQAQTLSGAVPGSSTCPSSSAQDSIDPQPSAQPLSNVDKGSIGNKIRKPPGEPGRPASGGYNLQEKLEMSRDRYRDVMNVMNQLVEKHLQGNKSITKQIPARLAIYHEEVG
ncbi:hypothetical protein FB107DRAFT_225327 [Schizophyllum commune]